MADYLEKLRNIGIMAHIDAGKTTVTERILYYTGRTYKIGEVHEGTAVMDYMTEEQERGITITSAATKCPWKDFEINLIDTPGHIDFTAEVERSLRVLDGVVAVFDASEGVQAQTETVWRQGQKYSLPCLCFVNKMDKIGADFEMTVESIRDKLITTPVCMQIPIGAGDSFEGVVDILKMKAVYYTPQKVGSSFEERQIPKQLLDRAEFYRHEMLETASEHDEQLMELYVHNKPINVEVLERAVRTGTLKGRLHPVFAGAALKNIGVRKLLDGVVSFLPSPLERPDLVGYKPTDKKKKETVRPDRSGSLVAVVFKITGDVHGDLNFLRIYQGILKSGSRVLNANSNKRENITRIYQMHANERKLLDSAGAGDIVAVVGLKQALTGDTICDTRHPVCLPPITFAQTVMSVSIEPVTSADKAKLAEALAALRREDPTFDCKQDAETGQTIISGMGELHLEILEHNLVRHKGVNVRVGRPRVAYKEAITRKAEAEGKFVRQTGGRGQYGHVVLTVEPLMIEDGHWSRDNEFNSRVIGGNVPKEYIGSVQRGALDALCSGFLGGFPVIGVKVTLTDGSYHQVDSSDIAFEQAAVIAVERALKKAGPVLLEPVMKLQVVVPEANFGAVQGNLLGKRGLITATDVHRNMCIIDARVPLVEMFGYSSELRSATGGRGSFTMEPFSYEKVPEQIAKKVLLL